MTSAVVIWPEMVTVPLALLMNDQGLVAVVFAASVIGVAPLPTTLNEVPVNIVPALLAMISGLLMVSPAALVARKPPFETVIVPKPS